jgi:hypothetical protein
MTNIVIKCRDILQDYATRHSDLFVYVSSKVFTLTQLNIISASISVYKNGALWSASNYSYDSTTNKVTVTGSLVVSDTLEIIYQYYKQYSDTEIQGQIRSALYHITAKKYKTFRVSDTTTIFPTPTEAEEDLIALIACILMSPNILSYNTRELEIRYVEKDTKEEKIEKTISTFQTCLGVFNFHKIYNPEEELL